MPESNSYLTYIVELKNQRANSIMPMLQPFARMPNSIVTGGDGNNLLILRDYSVNVRAHAAGDREAGTGAPHPGTPGAAQKAPGGPERAAAVAQIFNLPYRRLAVGRVSSRGGSRLRVQNPRYSRVQLCATSGAMKHPGYPAFTTMAVMYHPARLRS